MRLRKSILKRWAQIVHPSGHFLHRHDNILWLLNHHNYVDRHLGVFGGYETEQVEHLFNLSQKTADVFLDIGSNFGLYAVTAAVRGVSRKILAFEPDPRNAAQLAANLYLNLLTSAVSVRQAAVSDRSGTVHLALHHDRSTGKSRVAQADRAAIEVPCIALDSEFAWKDQHVMVKIDIEGHELLALRGMSNILRNNNCVMQIEIFSENQQGVERFLKKNGYRCSGKIGFDYYFERS